jgi:mannose-6-phosphate isomerase
MTERLDRLREAVRAPLPLAYHPLYRFYEGGSLTRNFRGLPDRPDDWWSEDWVGSCTSASNDDPDGRAQGMSSVELPGIGPIELKEIVEPCPRRWSARASPSAGGPAPASRSSCFASGPGAAACPPDPRMGAAAPRFRFGKTEAWILLDTPGDGSEPAYAGIGFIPGIDRDWFAAAVRRHDNASIRRTLHRTEVNPGEVYVAHAAVPHYLGPRISFIEVQEPTDHIVIPETTGGDDAGATMGLGWDLALDMIDYSGVHAEQTFARARQQPRVLRTSHASREIGLFADDVLEFFDATALEVQDEIEVSDGRFSIAIVASGAGFVEGDFGSSRSGGRDVRAATSLSLRVRAGRNQSASSAASGRA